MADGGRKSSTENYAQGEALLGTTPPKSEQQRVRSFSSGSIGSYNRAVLLAVDASDYSKNAFEWFLANVHRPDDLIVVVHCPEVPRLPTLKFKSGIQPPVDEWMKILEETNQRMRKVEEDYEGTCIQKKLKYKVRGESFKNPGEGILKVAEDEKVSLICMGSRGMSSAIKRTLLGSVSDYVIRSATVPVIVIPSRKGRGSFSTSPE